MTLYEIVDVDGIGTAQAVGFTTTVNPDGTATVSPTDPLSEGSHTLAITQTVSGAGESDLNQTQTRVDVNTAAPTLENPTDGALTSNNKPSPSTSPVRLHNSGAPTRPTRTRSEVDGQLDRP